MCKKIISPLVLFICLVLVITGLAAADRTDRAADRTKAATRAASSFDDNGSAEFSDLVRRVTTQSRSIPEFSGGKAAALLNMAAQQKGDVAVSTLLRILEIDLESTAENEKLLSEVYSRLGDLYEGTVAKQVHWYSLAMQYTPDPGARALLEARIVELGGEPFAVPSTREVGHDSCDDAAPITLDFSTNMSIIAPGDHDWFRFDITAGGGNHEIAIATLSDEPYLDDTDLRLWGGCSEGVPQEMLYYDDDGGEGFMSLIETGCLAYGTYFVEVGGWMDWVTPDDFTLEVTETGACDLPEPDGYEPDDTPEQASEIGLPTSLPLHANGWGRSRYEIQDHSISPEGDIDYVKFSITGSERVRIATAGTFPTFFNDFQASAPFDNPDTYVELLYGETPDYGGYCNNPNAGFPDFCYTNEDCVGLVIDPWPWFPDCVSLWDLIITGIIPWPGHRLDVLAYNDDRNPGGGDLGSELMVCLPRADRNTPSASAAEDWLVRIKAYSDTDTFDYQLMVRNEVACRFEVEPNNSFETANRLLGEKSTEIHGIYDYSAFGLTQDADLFYFDIDEETAMHFETEGYDSYEVDTALELYIGPDDYGNYFYTGVSNDDCFDWLSCLDVVLPPADELLGNAVADANYFINVTSWWFNLNYPYTLQASVIEMPTIEEEPNDTCETANEIGPNGIARGDFITQCDFDSWLLTIDEPSYVVLETDGGGDTTMVIGHGGGGQYLACDDDGGPAMGSRIEGCLDAGEYCVRLRPYGYWMNFDYQLSSSVTPGCLPTDPPSLISDGQFRCDGAGYASPDEEFDTCPN